ncbi:MAG: outer membrane protein assembly factor BamD [Lentisphaeria bacterium]|nr:outer membrane protein assembly factor BamD [Lentisphaeria bacterium]
MRLIFLLAIMLFAGTAVYADNAESSAIFSEALKAFNAKDYIEAAELFAKAEHKADSVELKLKAALREVESYKKAGYRGKEFDAIEKIIRRYPTYIDYKALVDREYALGDAYFHGYADPAFWSLRFIPWLTDKDRMFEIYQAALKHAPFAPEGANARLRLAVRYIKNNELEKALKLLKEIIRIYPDTETERYAMLELGNAFSEMSLNGDGDGKHFDEAMNIFREFKTKYPQLTENEWIKHTEAKARNAYAKRLHNIAKFYHREGRDEPAAAYLLEVMRRFPDTKSAAESEKLLTQLDKTYYPAPTAPAVAPEFPQYETLKFPEEQRKLLIAPENSNGKFLLPVYDLNLNKEKK